MVGVILNLTVWFALHVLFGSVTRRFAGPLRLLVPELASLSLAGAAAVGARGRAAVRRCTAGVITTLAVCGLALAALALHALAAAVTAYSQPLRLK